MKWLHKFSAYLFPTFLGISIFAITFNQTIVTDTYYNIKAGEVFMQQGLISHDIFSNVASGRTWFIYEWLFQIGIYLLQQIVGFSNIDIVMSIIASAEVVIVYVLLKRYFRIPSYILFTICLIYGLAVKLYLTARPQLIANLLFLIAAFFLFRYLRTGKNVLWLLIPLSWIWINVHASFILLFFLLGSYSICCWVLFWLKKDPIWMQKGRVLLLYTVGVVLLSFSPPLYGTQYQLLWLFYKDSHLLQFVTEWAPLSSSILLFIGYSVVIVIMAVTTLLVRKHITKQELIMAIPLAVLMVTPYLAVRNLLFSWLPIVLLMTVMETKLEQVKHKWLFMNLYLVAFISQLCLFYYGTSLFSSKPVAAYYPTAAATFILTQHIKGNMFNSFDYGDYLLYRLYPQQKVFVDGRADLYLCCELPQLLKLQDSNQSNAHYRKFLYPLLDNYHISFVQVEREEGGPIRISALVDNPQWSLVFWDDNAQIFARRNDLNDDVINRFGAVAASPYDTSLYDHKHVAQAISEFNRMDSISDSAKSRNILGIIYLKQNDITTATGEFQKAIQLNNEYPPPFVNLAYISVKTQNYPQAISYYEQAIQKGSTDPVPYITLGELYIKVDNDVNKAKDVWQQGLQKVSSPNAKLKLTQLINSY